MKIEDIRVGQHVYDPLPSMGYGQVLKVFKKSVWVKFIYPYGRPRCIYDLAHLQFLEPADKLSVK